MTLRCVRGGALVGMDEWLPSDAFDRDWGGLYPMIGCNHLVCAACGAPVRHWDGVRLQPDDPSVAPKVWAGDRSAFTDAPSARTYACRCNAISTAAYVQLADGDTEDFAFRSKWSCAGHPKLSVPCVLDGVSLGEAADIDAIVDGVVRGEVPANAPWRTVETDRPGYWLVRAYTLLAPSATADAIGRAMARRLGSDDPRALRCAWDFFMHRPDAVGAAEVGQAFLANQARLRATRDPFEPQNSLGSRCVDGLLARLAMVDASGKPVDPTVVKALRSAVLDGASPRHGLFALGAVDCDWLMAHAGDYLAKYPRNISTLIGACGSRSSGDLLVAQLIAYGRRDSDARRSVLAEAARLSADEREAVVAALETPQ